MSTTDCCQECRTFLEHADDLVATCTWRVHPWDTWSFSPACYFCAPEISEPKCRWFRTLIWCLPCHWSKGMDTSGMDDFPYRNLQCLKANVGVHLLADFLVPGPCQAFQQGEVFQVLSWCKTHNFFRKFGVMKMVLASARKKGTGTSVLRFFFGGLMDFDPRLSFCAIFSSKVPTYRNILDLEMKLVQTFQEHQMVEFLQEAWTYHGMAIFFSARSPRLIIVHCLMRINANRAQNTTFWNAVSSPWQFFHELLEVLNWGLASTFLSAWQKKDRSCDRIA